MDLAVFRVQNHPIWTKIHWKDILEGMVWTFNSSSGQVQKGECNKASDTCQLWGEDNRKLGGRYGELKHRKDNRKHASRDVKHF